jgi:hypothetical protein
MKKNPFIISENDRRHIMSLYGILTEEEKEYVIAGVLIGEDTQKGVGFAKVVIMDGKTIIKGANSGTDGDFEIKTKLDDLKTYTIKINVYGYLEYESPLDMTNLNQKLDITLTSKSKDLKVVDVTEKGKYKNSEKTFFLTDFNVNFKDSENNNISGVKIIGVQYNNGKLLKLDLPNSDKDGNLKVNISHLGLDLDSTEENPKQTDRKFKIYYKKNKFKDYFEATVKSPTKKLYVIGMEGEISGDTENFYGIIKNNTIFVKKDLENTNIITSGDYDPEMSLTAAITPKLKELGYTKLKVRNLIKIFGGWGSVEKKLNLSDFTLYGEQNGTIDVQIETSLDIQIEVVNKNNNRIPNAKVEVYADKQKTNLITTEYTDEEGVIKTKVNLLDTESEDDELSNKSKIWLEITKKGYDDYFQNFSVSRNNFIISASLNDFSYTPDVVNTDYKKETTFFRFVGKNSYDIKGQLDGDYDMAEKRAKNDALMQFLKSSKKYRNNKKLIEALSYKIPDGGKVVYKRKYSNGYYAIVEMSRRELNRFVKSFINANTKENENQKIEFFNFNFTNTLKSLNEEFPGSVIAVFYYVDYKYISELEKNKSVVERLNGGNFSLKVNENTPDKSAIATFFNFTTTNKIAIVDANQNILLNQTIYSNNDINFVAEKINKLLTK